jgi:uncharacterized membrane protein YhaH (DUF805 family)
MKDQLQLIQRRLSNGKSSLFSFESRIKRSTFWKIIIPVLLISLGLSIVFEAEGDPQGLLLSIAGLILSVPLVWVLYAAYIKRLHDLGKNGWYALLVLVPLINLLFILYLGFVPGNTGVNKYGEEPH